jgi:hypothetical protein
MAAALDRGKVPPKGMGLYDFAAHQEGSFAAETGRPFATCRRKKDLPALRATAGPAQHDRPRGGHPGHLRCGLAFGEILEQVQRSGLDPYLKERGIEGPAFPVGA